MLGMVSVLAMCFSVEYHPFARDIGKNVLPVDYNSNKVLSVSYAPQEIRANGTESKQGQLCSDAAF